MADLVEAVVNKRVGASTDTSGQGLLNRGEFGKASSSTVRCDDICPTTWRSY